MSFLYNLFSIVCLQDFSLSFFSAGGIWCVISYHILFFFVVVFPAQVFQESWIYSLIYFKIFGNSWSLFLQIFLLPHSLFRIPIIPVLNALYCPRDPAYSILGFFSCFFFFCLCFSLVIYSNIFLRSLFFPLLCQVYW